MTDTPDTPDTSELTVEDALSLAMGIIVWLSRDDKEIAAEIALVADTLKAELFSTSTTGSNEGDQG